MPHQSVALSASMAEGYETPDPDALFDFFRLSLSVTAREHHWRRIERRYRSAEARLDIRAVALDYFLEAGVLREPVLVEQTDLRNAEALAYRDGLTGLHNYAYFEQQLELESARAHRYRTPLCLVLVDLDGFKSINDRFGHAMGNQVLKDAGRLLRADLRQGDVVARLGGDEFALLLHHARWSTGARIATRKREAIEAWFQTADGAEPALDVTASFGVAELGQRPSLFEAADRALYRAKERGKNRVSAGATG